MTYVDLHLHSNCSDGADSPEVVVERAAALGIAAIALADHDTVAGVAAARKAAEAQGMGFLDAVEVSASLEGRELHILAYGVHIQSPVLLNMLQNLREMRQKRIERILGRLESSGIPVRDALAERKTDFDMTGRMHVAVLLHRMGVVPTVQKAFEHYLNRRRLAYVPKELPEAADVIRTIHDAHGLAFLAHPGLGKNTKGRLTKILELPFDGIEVWHTSHTPDMCVRFSAIAQEKQLLCSGGSDCHGAVKGEHPTMGRIKTPLEQYHRICSALSSFSSC